MVLAVFGQIAYLVLMSIALLFLMISMFTPGLYFNNNNKEKLYSAWRNIVLSNSANQKYDDIPSSGMFVCETLDVGTCLGVSLYL